VLDLEAQRDYMDMVCRSFASRLERRRNLVISSARFHRLVEQVRGISFCISVTELYQVNLAYFGVSFLNNVYQILDI